jgi:hypothetical protein
MIEVRKKKNRSLMIRLSNPDEKEVHRDVDRISIKLFEIFRNHIGKENAISSFDLFKEIYNTDPSLLDVFQRNYLWSIIKVMLSGMRSREELFVVSNASKLFVLKDKNELTAFKQKMDRVIDSIEDTKIKAQKWVLNKSWRNI